MRLIPVFADADVDDERYLEFCDALHQFRHEDELAKITALVTDGEKRNPEIARETGDWQATASAPRPPLVVAVPSAGTASNARIDQIRSIDKFRILDTGGKLNRVDSASRKPAATQRMTLSALRERVITNRGSRDDRSATVRRPPIAGESGQFVQRSAAGAR